MNWIVLFLLSVHTMTLAGSSNKIYWTIKDLPFIYGRNVTLFCNTSAVGSQKTTWMKQSNVILHHGLSFQPDKYSGKEESDGSSLIIMNPTISDFNTSYTCLSDVYSYESVLEMTNSSFICLPQRSNNSWTINGRDILVQLKIDRFFPVPTCQTMFNGDMLITNQQESVHLQNRFYYGTINITSQAAADLCGGNLTVVCKFGGLYSEAIEIITLQNCDGSEFPEHGFGMGRIIIVCFLCVILCALMICILDKYRFKLEMQKDNKEETKSLQITESHGNGSPTNVKDENETAHTCRQNIIKKCYNFCFEKGNESS